MVSQNRVAAVGLVLIIVPLVFTVSAVIETRFGIGALSGMWGYFLDDPKRFAAFNLIAPIFFLGALAVAMVSNLLVVSRLRLRREPGKLMASTITLYPRAWNLAVLALSGALSMTMLGYAVVENLGPH